MNRTRRILCLLAVFCLMIPGMVRAEAIQTDPMVIVTYDRSELLDWSPSYGLTMPGILLELSHAEAMLSITAIEEEGVSAADYLSGLLDRAGETLAVSNAHLTLAPDSLNGFMSLSYSYTYPAGDEIHLIRSWVTTFENMILDVTVDAWGEDADQLINAAQRLFIDQGLTLTVYESASELTATFSDVVENESGHVCIQLTEAGKEFSRTDIYYPLAENAVLLFPNPDDPLLLDPVSPDFASLVDAILAYEESSDSPAVFRTIIDSDQIVYMEYGLMQ